VGYSEKMFDRTLIPFVDMSYKTLEILAHAVTTVEPACAIVARSDMDMDEQKILHMWTSKKERVGFGPNHFYGSKEPHNARKGEELTYRSIVATSPFKSSGFANLISATLPELFLRVAPFRGGLEALSGYAKSDQRYMEPTFIAAIILAPVTKIVRVILTIMQENNLFFAPFKNKKLSLKNQVKVKKLLECWYTVRYLKILAKYQPGSFSKLNTHKDEKQKDDKKRKIWRKLTQNGNHITTW